MNLQECYRLLEVTETASDDEVSRSFKRMALKYHPDKNPDRIEWATRAMANINSAYSTIISERFQNRDDARDEPEPASSRAKGTAAPSGTAARGQPAGFDRTECVDNDFLTEKFIRFRELAKDALYRYFQFSLFNQVRRELPANQRKFTEVVLGLRKSYHAIKKLAGLARDPELIEHFSTFSAMLFNFYRAAECSTLLDTYKNPSDVEAYRLYKKADEALHIAHREIFYDRHNRGQLKRQVAVDHILLAEQLFQQTLERYHKSSWAVETGIKLEYVHTLKNYFALFFNE